MEGPMQEGGCGVGISSAAAPVLVFKEFRPYSCTNTNYITQPNEPFNKWKEMSSGWMRVLQQSSYCVCFCSEPLQLGLHEML